jgi:hypothetical protein
MSVRFGFDYLPDRDLMDPILLRKRWLHQLGQRWGSDAFVTTNQYRSAETDALVAAATLVPDPIMPELPRLRIEDMNNLLTFEDDDADDDIQEHDLDNFPGVLKNEPALEESLFVDQEEQDDNIEDRVAIKPETPPASDRTSDRGHESTIDVEMVTDDYSNVLITPKAESMEMLIDTETNAFPLIGE